MPELPKTVEEAIELAIAAEIDANLTYLHLAKMTKKPESKSLFQNLARDEQWHKEALEERYQAITQGKQPKSVSASIEGAVLRRKAKEDLAEMEILNLAIEAEIAAYGFYTGTAKMTDDAETKQTFLRLAKDEQQHRELLEKEIQGRQGKPTDEMELDNWVRE
jgi:rubrerythrin